MALVVKNPPANVGDVTKAGLIPGLGTSPDVRHGNPVKYYTWRIPWAEEPGILQSIGPQSQTQLKQLTQTHNIFSKATDLGIHPGFI